jgi:DNA polymerase-1
LEFRGSGLPEQRRVAKNDQFWGNVRHVRVQAFRELGIPRKDADRFLEHYSSSIPGFSLLSRNDPAGGESGKVTTLLGRERPVPAINSRNKTKKPLPRGKR